MLRGSNKEVVLKVLKPGVEDVLQTDLNFIVVVSKVDHSSSSSLSCQLRTVGAYKIPEKTICFW